MNENYKVAVIIPFYRDTISWSEKIALQQCEKILSAYPKIAIKPESLILPLAAGEVNFIKVTNFADDYFDGIKGYNKLMMSELFYGSFLEYEYILIYQLDAFVFKDELNFWCSRRYDYIGAPWLRDKSYRHFGKELVARFVSYLHARFDIQKNGLPGEKQFHNRVGNGGFSLRRVRKFHELSIERRAKVIKYLSRDEHEYNEDMFWSVEINRTRRRLRIPSYKIGIKFSMEIYPDRALKLNNGELPFGCHAWDIHTDFWRPIFKTFGYDI